MPEDLLTRPDEVPTEIWEAAKDLYARRHTLILYEADQIRRPYDVEETRYVWCIFVSRIITSHISTHRRMIEGTVKP